MPQTVLLLEDNCANVERVEQALHGSVAIQFDVERLRRCSDVCARLATHRKRSIAAVLTNLYLPDSQGLQTIARILEVSPYIPILILADPDHEDIARRAIVIGAQDYVLLHRLDQYQLPTMLHNMMYRSMNTLALAIAKERAHLTLNAIGKAVISTDLSGNITYLNQNAEVLTGWTAGEALGRPFPEVFQVEHRSEDFNEDPILAAMEQNKTIRAAAGSVLLHRGGHKSAVEDAASPIRDRSGRIVGAAMSFHQADFVSVTRPPEAHFADRDPLTDLPNKLLLNDRVLQAMAVARRHRDGLAVLLVDIDRFKHVNDALGRKIGDALLTSVAKRILAGVRDSDSVMRLGGDQFIVILQGLAHEEDAALCAQIIMTAIAVPHFIDGHELQVTSCVGIGVYPQDGTEPRTLVASADIAVLNAKDQGRNSFAFLKPHANEYAIERGFVESGLRHALARSEFVLHYQPTINLKSGAVVGLETLIRWVRPKRGLAQPGDFLSVAEQSGHIVAIGRWVLHEACRQSQRWREAGLTPPPLAVNISAIELRSTDFVSDLRDILRDTNSHPSHLELEITERTLALDCEATVTVLQELRELGVRVTADQFTAGTSSLTHLRRLPVDAIKIDPQLVRHLGSNADQSSIVNAIIHAGKCFDLRVVAHGVESAEQYLALQRYGCVAAQGRYFHGPMPDQEVAKLLIENRASQRGFSVPSATRFNESECT